MDTICEKCSRILQIGDFPFCPHGRGRAGINRDEIPGGVVLENYGPQPIRFDSHSERRAYMERHGLHEKETFCPLPGTDKDPQGIPNPAGYADPVTLANAAELICRNGRSSNWDGEAAGVISFTHDTISGEEASEIARHATR